MPALPNAPPILARDLVKRYGALIAVDGVSFSAQPGTCLGLLGPNGAGKTTTIEVLEGLLKPDGGDVRILGRTWQEDGRFIRERIGVQLQETRVPEKLTVLEVLQLFHSFYSEGRDLMEVLDRVGLAEKRNARTVNLSGGQRQRLALGCALVSRPEILFLDEPTTGLDPQARRRVWEIVEEFKGEGGTVLLTTHYMDEAERLADDLVILDHGKIIAEGSPQAIIDTLNADSIVALTLEPGAARPDFTGLAGVVSVRTDAAVTELTVRETHHTLPAILDRLRETGSGISDLRTHRPTLEDVFVALTGRHLRDE